MEQGSVIAAQQADDWDRHWTELPAADISPSTAYRIRVIRKLLGLKSPGEGARVLEIGSGTGAFAAKFVGSYPRAEFLGLDLSAAGVRKSAGKVPSAIFRQRNLLLPPTSGDNLDFGATHAIASEVLEHVDEPEKLLRNSAPYMAPGCKLIVTVPGGPLSAFHQHIGHRRHYTTGDLRDVMSRAGFVVEHAHGVGFPFFNLYSRAVLLRGEKFLDDVGGQPGLAIRTASAVFNSLFYLNSMKAGWQMVAVARWPG